MSQINRFEITEEMVYKYYIQMLVIKILVLQLSMKHLTD